MRFGIFFRIPRRPTSFIIQTITWNIYILIDNKLFHLSVQHRLEFHMKWMHFIGNHKTESWCTLT